jgi:hypothetical protein
MMWSPEEYRRIWLPYAVKKINDKIGGWVPLNRRYKPLGVRTDQWIEYEDVPREVRIKSISVPQQKKIHHGCELAARFEPNTMIWLYHDSIIPTQSAKHWDSYQQRLYLLSRLKCFGAER